MTGHFEELEKLITDYEEVHGKGKGWEIFGSLAFSHGIRDQIQVFLRAKGRMIVVEHDPDALDEAIIRYRGATTV
jgi:hypothetical protein